MLFPHLQVVKILPVSWRSGARRGRSLRLCPRLAPDVGETVARGFPPSRVLEELTRAAGPSRPPARFLTASPGWRRMTRGQRAIAVPTRAFPPSRRRRLRFPGPGPGSSVGRSVYRPARRALMVAMLMVRIPTAVDRVHQRVEEQRRTIAAARNAEEHS